MSRITISRNDVSQTFDLEEIFGVDPSLRPEIGLSFAQDVIDRIIQRTQDENKDINGSGFAPYSESYKKSDAYTAFRKDSSVDMTLTGSMLGDLDIIEFDGRFLKIGFIDDTEIAKAYNHNFGDTLPARKFFGVTERELDEIASSYADDIGAMFAQQESATSLADLLGLNEEAALPSFRPPPQVATLLSILGED